MFLINFAYQPDIVNEALFEKLWSQPLGLFSILVVVLLFTFNLILYLNRKKGKQSDYLDEKYRACLEVVSTYTPNAIVMLDSDGAICFANRRFLDLFGSTFSQINGKKINEAELPEEFTDFLNSSDKKSFSIRGLNGMRESHVVISHPIITDSNRNIGEILLIEPEARKELYNQIDRSEFNIRDLSHNLKTPLNSILGYCQLLSGEKGLNQDQKKYLSTISENSFRLLNRINGLLGENPPFEKNGVRQQVSGNGKKSDINKILIVDDVSINRTFLRIMLERHGYQLIEAQNGQEALDRILSDSPDLVLMDIMMPVMDGMETLEIIRSYNNHYSELPIIAVTANSRYGSKKKFIDAGFNGYLQKPFKEKDLIDMIST